MTEIDLIERLLKLSREQMKGDLDPARMDLDRIRNEIAKAYAASRNHNKETLQ